jgi:hypothetical protein
MKFDALPAPILAKLLRLEEQAALCEDTARRCADSIKSGQARLRRPAVDDLPRKQHDDLIVAVRQMVEDQPKIASRASAAQEVVRTCKNWLASLPEGSTLQRRVVDTRGHTLASVRARIGECEDEFERLRKVPTPSPDLKDRIRSYVAALARPKLSGIEDGQRLRVDWPDDGPTLAAFLAPDVVIAAVMREVTRMASDPLPPPKRKERMAALASEITELRYLEEALTTDQHERSGRAPPWAVLGAEIVAAGAEQKAGRERASA